MRPNLQQLPRQGGVRACITAEAGHLLVGADFSGVELRVAAALSGDTTLRRMITDGVDIHGLIARQVFGPSASKADRYAVKRGVFGRLYGGGIPTLAAQVGCTQEVAAAMVATLDSLTPQLTAWAARLRSAVKAGRNHYRTYSGAPLLTGWCRGTVLADACLCGCEGVSRTIRTILVFAGQSWYGWSGWYGSIRTREAS